MMADQPPHNPAPPPIKKPGRWRWPALLLSAVIALSAGGGWLSYSTSGLQWLAATVSRISAGKVSLAGVSGTLLESMAMQSLIIGSSDLRITARDVRLVWRPAALLDGRLEITALVARDVEVLSLPSIPSSYPESLLLPLPLSLHKLDIGTLRITSKEGGAPDFAANNLSARLESDGRRHLLQEVRASLEYGKLTASGQMDGTRPFALQAQADLAGLSNFTGLEAREAHISATASGNLMQLTINAEGGGAGLTGKGEAQLTPYAAFPLAALRLQVSGLNPRAFSPEAPQANLTLNADLRGNAGGRLEGNMTAKNISPAPIDRGGLPLLEARAHATLSADLLQFDKLALALAGGGSISGQFAWQRERAMGSADLGINHLDPAALDTRLRAARLNGSIKLSGNVSAQQGVLALTGMAGVSPLTIKPDMPVSPTPTLPRSPKNFWPGTRERGQTNRYASSTLNDGSLQLEAHLAKSGDTLTLDNLRLARGQAALTGQGKLELGGRRAYTFKGELQRFDLAAFLRAPRSNLNATLELAGELEPQASGTLHFIMSDSRLADQPVSGSGQVEFVGMSRGKGEAELQLGDNRLSAKGSFGAATDRLQIDLVAPVLAQLGYGFGGSVNAHASLIGSVAQPEVTLEAEGSNLVLPGDHHLSSLTAVASLHGEALALKVNTAGYGVKEKAFLRSMQLEVHGSRSHHALGAEALLDNGSKLILRANGGLTDPAKGWKNIQWQGALTELSGTGALPFKLLTATPLTLDSDHVSLDAAEFAVAGGKVHINSAAWTPQQWNSRGSFTGIGLRAGNEAQPGFTAKDSQESLRLGGEWGIASSTQLAGSLRVARESGDWVLPGDQPLPLGLQSVQLIAHAADGQLTGEMTALGEHLGAWHAGIVMPLTQAGAGWAVSANAPLTGQVHINMPDLAWVGPAINGNLKSDGQLTLQADITGTFGAPRLLGKMHGDDLALAFLDQNVRLQQGQLAARFDQESLHIDTLSFSTPYQPQPSDRLLTGLNLAREPGKLTVSGAIGLNGENGNLKISASRLPLAQRADRWIIASGSGQASLNKNILTLGGSITADAGLISQPAADRPQLSDDIVITGRQTIARKGPNISVDAILNLGEHFYLRASGLEARLAGQLSVHDASGQQLRVTGTIAASDAIFEAYGQRLTVERGLVNFQGPLYDPGLNILALRKGLSVEAGVEVTGTALHPSVRLVSTPAVPDAEKLSWIVLGRLPDAAGTDSSMLLAAAGSILGGGSGGGLTGRLKQTLGMDELSLRQAENGNSLASQAVNDNPLSSQIITVGKRLSARAFLSYEQGISAAAGVTKLTYTLTPRVNIVTQAGFDNAIDVFYIFSFD